MRISKKFVGSNYNGKQVYVRRKNTLSNDEVRSRRAKLQELERKFLAKASPMSAMSSNDNISSAGGSSKPSSQADLQAAAAGLLGGSGMSSGMDAALMAGRPGSNSKAAAAGRALLLGGSGGLKSSGTGGLGGTNLAGFSSAELAAELEKRSQGEDNMESRSSVENFLGSAAELQARASVETLLQNPFGRTGSRSNLFTAASGSRSNLLNPAASGSRNNLLNAGSSGSRNDLLDAARGNFHRGTSASNLLNAALQKNSTSNLLNAARGSFHKNSTSNLLNGVRNSSRNMLSASAFGRGTSASNLLNANFKKNSTSNLLNAMASSGALRKGSTSNLLNAARAGGDSSGLQSLLAARAERASGSRDARNSAASLSDLLERHSSMNFRDRVNGLMDAQSGKNNWSSKLGAARGSRSNLANLRMSMQNDEEGGASSIFGNSSFGGGGSSSGRKGLAELLKEKGMGAAAALAAAGAESKQESLSAEMLEKEALMRQLQGSGGFDSGSSPIGEYLLKQQLAGNRDEGAAASGDADEAELRHMLELKRKFLSQDAAAELEERAAKRLR